ncbi:MAG: transketolase [Acidobacteria bacterium]|nr:transketolase [Acidobacteriota bacterium]
MHTHDPDLVRDIAARAQEMRIDALKMVFQARSGHLGGAFSAAEITAALMFHHLRLNPDQPEWEDRDRLLFSKGHACAILYSAMARRGFFPREELGTFRCLDSRLQGHPDRLKLKGIEIPAGPLGHGVAVGAGIALALRMDSSKPSAWSAPSARASRAKVYVLLGDGEINAGIVWEGAMLASKYRLGNLTAIVDCNGIQQTGATADVMPTEPIMDKWKAFGWHPQEVNGHDVRQILEALDLADEVHARPSVIMARTTKGKGVSFMEYDHRWHGGVPNRQEFERAIEELQKGLESCRN